MKVPNFITIKVKSNMVSCCPSHQAVSVRCHSSQLDMQRYAITMTQNECWHGEQTPIDLARMTSRLPQRRTVAARTPIFDSVV